MFILKANTRGFSTVEMLIAFAIIIMCLSAVVSLIFGGQVLALDGQLSLEAKAKAENILYNAQHTAARDFNALNPLPEVVDGTFKKKLQVKMVDVATKNIESKVSWQSGGRNLEVSLNTLITNYLNPDDPNTCYSVLSNDWQNPQISNFDFAQAVGDAGGIYTITDVDAYRNRLYVTVNNSSANKETFFVFDTSDVSNPALLAKIDNDPNNTGLNSVLVQGNYAYVASASSYVRGQLQIFDISGAVPQLIKYYKLPVINPGGTINGLGNSLALKKTTLYLGLNKTNREREFNILDVATPSSPVFKSSFTVGGGVNGMVVKTNYVLVSTDDNAKEVTTFDVSDASNPFISGKYDAVGSNGFGFGKSLWLVDDRLYLGRTYVSTAPEFYVLNANDLSTDLPPALGSYDPGPNVSNPFSVNQIIVRDYLAFLLLGSGSKGGSLKVLNISNPALVTLSASLPLPGDGSGGAAMDCEGNTFFIGSNDALGKGYLSVVTAGS